MSYSLLANALVLAGAGILMSSLVPARQLLAQVPRGRVRTTWAVMAGLTVCFIAGYLAYAIVFWKHHADLADLIVPCVFFLGACFVLSSSALSLQAVKDVRRITLLERETITDALSGMYNRRYLDRRLEEELAKAQRYHTPLSILLVDVDQFKQINDTLGHQAGDCVLSCLGKVIIETIRVSDVAARYGGDEILIMAPNTPLAQAGVLAERLRLAIESRPIVLPVGHEPGRTVGVTVCIGVAGCAENVECLQRLVQAADEALYRAKAAGRNRVAV